LLVRNAHTGGVALGKLQMNRHFTWMIPTANAVIFAIVGLGLYALALLRPRWEAKGRPIVLCFLAFLALLLLVPRLYPTAPLALAGGFAYLVGRRIATHSRTFGARVKSSLPCFAVGLTCLSAWVSGKSSVHGEWVKMHATIAGQNRPNVLLIVMDTVRASSLSLYGYHRDTTPNLARLARRGITFEQARATAPWTLPSHASMFTGRLPHDLSADETTPLDATWPTIAAYLSTHGYATGGFVGNVFFCNAWYGLARGFEHYEDFYGDEVGVSIAETIHCSRLGHGFFNLTSHALPPLRTRKDAARINGDLLDWLSTAKGRPFFAFLNYFDAHAPFVPPDGFERRFGPGPQSDADHAMLREWTVRAGRNLPARAVELVRDGYDDCIASLDQEIGRLFDELERREILDDTLVIITSDHGESMGEHGYFGHGTSLYNQEVHVPLIVIPPGGRSSPVRIRRPVSLCEIPATVVDLLGLAEASPFPGASLARHWGGSRRTNYSRVSPVISEVSLREKFGKSNDGPPAFRGPLSSLAARGKTYIRAGERAEELYDLARDPAQSHDLSGSAGAQPILDELRARLSRTCRELDWSDRHRDQSP
jgi:arylsulfatase A-like enzyme